MREDTFAVRGGRSSRTVWMLLSTLLASSLPVACSRSRSDTADGVPSQGVILLADVGDTSPDRAAIYSMLAQGIMKPLARNRFGPADPMTRGAFAVALQALLQLPERSTVKFDDVPRDSPLHAAVTASWMFMSPRIQCPGCNLKSLFKPDLPMQRGGSLLALSQALVASGRLQLPDEQDAKATLARLRGIPPLPPQAARHVAAAIKAGLVKIGEAPAPLEMTRAETAALLSSTQTAFSIPRIVQLGPTGISPRPDGGTR